jgi:hypothetical protein
MTHNTHHAITLPEEHPAGSIRFNLHSRRNPTNTVYSISSCIPMHPPLDRPHPDCQSEINDLHHCHATTSKMKFWGCNEIKYTLDRCLREEKVRCYGCIDYIDHLLLSAIKGVVTHKLFVVLG